MQPVTAAGTAARDNPGMNPRTASLFASILLAAGAAIAQETPRSVERELAATARDLGRDLPRMVDPITRWDSVAAGPGARFEYTFTLTDRAGDDPALERIFHALVTPLRETACTSGTMRYFFEHGVDVVYVYRSDDGRWQRSATVSVLDCGPRQFIRG